MGMMTIATHDKASPTKVLTFRVVDLKVDDEGMIRARLVGAAGEIVIEPENFITIVNTFDWGGTYVGGSDDA